MSKDAISDMCHTSDFKFADAEGQKKFLHQMRAIADEIGPEAAKRFEIVLTIGERVQERLLSSNKMLANVFNYVMDQIAKEASLGPVEKGDLTDAFIKYSVHGHQLDVELKLKAEQRQKVKRLINSIATMPEDAYDLEDVTRDPYETRNNIAPAVYSFRREAGPG